ncbi:CDP-glucose 4,6-dehydratase [Polynucleobacter sp. TUM22923]|uniref:CDP-glucose 4,6-dehydratase n=1 Tax=Polynucleobacter sp. TUM22923 TaxID=3022126 RepID=UPI002573BAA0|nr:CDP-glucose 4,6-dehydratase [Polynucleobacter sp. TUM22923]BDX22494.1 CDP-glucose 4,6-dehydratase [Polynucleobacter sp. TUM22923]
MEGVGMNPSFWSGKKVFLTGHTGFKGSWLSLWLQQLGAQVTGYALQPPTNPSLFEVAQVAQGMTSIIGDIRDGTMLTNAMRQAAPDIVIHMAAQPLVRRSYVDPVETYSTNVMGTVNLLEAVRQTPSVRAIVNVTTDKCYENKEWVWGYRENEPMGGFDPYSSSKGCAELVTAAYRNSFFNSSQHSEHQVALATARAGNVIGGGDWAEDRLIPDILRAIQNGQRVNIRNPHATRPWQHVLEPLSGYLALAEKLYTDGAAFAEAFNFGPAEEDAKPVQWIVEQLTQSWGDGASWHLDGGTHPHEAHYLKLDCSKARATLGWQPHWQLGQTLQAIIVWHKAHSALKGSQDMRSLCLQQINDYSTAI